MAVRFLGIDDDGLGKDGRLPCFAADAQGYFPAFSSLVNEVAVAQVDQYGALGITAAAQNPQPPRTVPPWWVCPFIDFTDGPFIEGMPDQDPVYEYRWKVFMNLLTRRVTYGRVGTTLANAPTDLIPASTLPAGSTEITLGFDAVARPVFGWENAGRVYLAWYSAGVPTFIDFAGITPRLFFDGMLQRDNTLTDVVCYYIRAGVLQARFYRDNFAVEYTIADVSGTFGALTRLTVIGRESTNYRDTLRMVLFAWGTPNTVEIELRSAAYPPFPVIESDFASFGISAPSGVYEEGIVDGGSYSDAASLGIAAPSGSYDAVIIDGGTYSDSGSFGITAPSGSYNAVIISGGTYQDSASFGIASPSGTYTLVVVAGGSYADSASFGISAPTGTYS